MARVTASEVLSIMDNVILADPIVDTYILGANALVNSLFGVASTDLLKEIERWLAAHLIAVSRERQSKKEGAGGAFIEYAGEFGSGLDSTSYGQMAKMLDTTGKVAGLSLKRATSNAVKS